MANQYISKHTGKEIDDAVDQAHWHDNKIVLDEITDTDITNWNNKVDKVAGKRLSTNDYTDADKAKVSNSRKNIYLHLDESLDIPAISQLEGANVYLSVFYGNEGLPDPANYTQLVPLQVGVYGDPGTEVSAILDGYDPATNTLYHGTISCVIDSSSSISWTTKKLSENIKDGTGVGSLYMNNTSELSEPNDGGDKRTESTLYPDNKTPMPSQTTNVAPQANGTGAFAIGINTIADGDVSVAEGINTRAGYVRDDGTRNIGSHAEGIGSFAKSSAAHAEGYFTSALGSNSHTEGFFNTVESTAWSGHAEGRENTVAGKAAHAEGYLNTITDTAHNAHAEGENTSVSAQDAHAEGYKSVASGYAAHAEGASASDGTATTASGRAAHAEGSGTTSSGAASHSEGGKTTASGNQSHAEGFNTQATATYAHSEGVRTHATASATHAEGADTYATGEAAHAEGKANKASGKYSHTGGFGNEAKNFAGTVIGQYAKISDKSSVTYDSTAEAFVVGNGTADNARSNAFEVHFDGTAKLGGKAVATEEYVNVAASAGISFGTEEKYFDITIGGVVSLKPEYRGACPSDKNSYVYAISNAGIGTVGTKNSELPTNLIIPRVINGLTPTSMAPGMFLNNHAIKEITLPYSITSIPDSCFYNCYAERVLNTQHIISIGAYAFDSSRITCGIFPNVEELGDGAFARCANLRLIDIGNVTKIPLDCFYFCNNLEEIRCNKDQTSIGDYAFFKTRRLKNVAFLPLKNPNNKISTIGKRAFFECGLNFTYEQWKSFSNTFDTEATPAEANAQFFWSNFTKTPILNNLPTTFDAYDPRWADKTIGNSGKKYKSGCVFFSIIEAFCGFNNLKFDTIDELEAYLDTNYNGWRTAFTSDLSKADSFVNLLGMTCEHKSIPTNTEEMQVFYNAISDGKYIVCGVPGGKTSHAGHAVLVRGMNSQGEFITENSSSALTLMEIYETHEYAMLFQNMCMPYKNESGVVSALNLFLILSKNN